MLKKMVKIRLTELKKIIKNVLTEMDFSDEVKMMVAQFNKRPNPDINAIMGNFEKISNIVGSGSVKFLRPKQKVYQDKGGKIGKDLFAPPIAIYLDLGSSDEETIIYDLDKNEYIFQSWGEFYVNWASN